MIRINWKKTSLVVADILLGVYLLLAVTAFNKPETTGLVCSQVKIDISDSGTEGFLNTDEIKKILQKNNMYPLGRPIGEVNCREMEEFLMSSPFVDKAQCYKTQNGHINIMLTQRMPVIRIMAEDGSNYYIDSHGGIMGNIKYTADMIIATGRISQKYAQNSLSRVANFITGSKLWNSQIEQINVLDDGTMELVPRVGDHTIYIGSPTDIEQKFDRLEKFYRYGLSKAGWNKYKYINVEFGNQIICRRNDSDQKEKADADEPELQEHEAGQHAVSGSDDNTAHQQQ